MQHVYIEIWVVSMGFIFNWPHSLIGHTNRQVEIVEFDFNIILYWTRANNRELKHYNQPKKLNR